MRVHLVVYAKVPLSLTLQVRGSPAEGRGWKQSPGLGARVRLDGGSDERERT